MSSSIIITFSRISSSENLLRHWHTYVIETTGSFYRFSRIRGKLFRFCGPLNGRAVFLIVFLQCMLCTLCNDVCDCSHPWKVLLSGTGSLYRIFKHLVLLLKNLFTSPADPFKCISVNSPLDLLGFPVYGAGFCHLRYKGLVFASLFSPWTRSLLANMESITGSLLPPAKGMGLSPLSPGAPYLRHDLATWYVHPRTKLISVLLGQVAFSIVETQHQRSTFQDRTSFSSRYMVKYRISIWAIPSEKPNVLK